MLLFATLLMLVSLTSVSAKDVSYTANLTGTEPGYRGGGMQVIDLEKYPFMVNIPYISVYNYRYEFAQGVAINMKFVLTSGYVASTVLTGNISNYFVISEAVDVSGQISGRRHRILESLPHPDYPTDPTLDLYKDNVGLIKVCPVFRFSKYAMLPLSQGALLSTGNSGSIVSWGVYPSYLVDATGTIASDAECSSRSAIQLVRPFNSSDSFCTRNDTSFFLCLKDDGAPYLVNDVVVGVASIGGCGHVYLDTFTRVDPFLTWIQDNARV